MHNEISSCMSTSTTMYCWHVFFWILFWNELCGALRSCAELSGAERGSLLKRVTFLYLGFVFTFSLSISRTHGTEKEKEQPDWRKYQLPLEM